MAPKISPMQAIQWMASLKESSQVFLHRITRKTGEAHINDLQSRREMCVSDQPPSNLRICLRRVW